MKILNGERGKTRMPVQFALLLAYLNERLKRKGKKKVEIGRKKMFVLAYVDDVVLLAKQKESMRLMMGELKDYLKKTRLEVNAGKSKNNEI